MADSVEKLYFNYLYIQFRHQAQIYRNIFHTRRRASYYKAISGNGKSFMREIAREYY